MMEPMDPLRELAMCCGLGRRRRDFGPPMDPRNYYYSPSTAHLSAGNTTTWPLSTQFGPPPQPYLLFTQPVIIAGNPAAPSQANTMTWIQHAQSASPTTSPFQALPVMAGPQPVSQQQPNLIASQNAIYSSTAAVNTSVFNAPSTSIYDSSRQANLNRGKNTYLMATPSQHQVARTISTQIQRPEKRNISLTSEILRELEKIEKQVDLTKDMELIERFGIVITRALDPYSLREHLTEATLRRYHNHFLMSEDYVIRFIEIIKRPGQTLGLYIRNVQFESPHTRLVREGLVITKIESDSPIYNSQVLHVGDEILSINLIDVQGMSLDDVVIIMSIPRRLVLALRIPKERDQLLRANLIHQHQVIRSSIERETGSTKDFREAMTSIESVQRAMDSSMRLPLTDAIYRNDANVMPIDNRNGDFEVVSRAKTDLNASIHHARPIRVQSALQVNEVLNGKLPGGEFAQDNYDNDYPRRYSSSGDRPFEERFGLDRPNFNDNITSAAISHSQEQTLGSRMGRQSGASSAIGDDNNHEDRFRNLGIDSEIASLERDAMNKEKPKLSDLSQAPFGDNRDSDPDGSQRISSKLPRRTLPIRPDLAGSSSSSIKQPIISNLHLGDTPEQSSYFSSSIDAINRELKELRRQRMALGSNEPSLDSRIDF